MRVGAQAGVLGEGVAEERQIRVEGAGPTHAAVDASRLVLDRGADGLTVEAELGRDGPHLPMLAVVQAPDLGALRGRDHRSSSSDRRGAPAWQSATGSTGRRPRSPRGRGRRNRGAVRDGESGRRSRCGGSLIRHAAPNAIGVLPVAVVEAPFGTALMSSPRRLHRPPATERPAGWPAVGVASVAGRADREENAAMATAALAERVVHGVGARRAGPDWTARRIRGTTAGTGSVCRSSRRSRGSRTALRALTPHLSPPRTLPERAAPRQRRGCGRRRSRGRKERAHRRCAKPRRRGFAQRPQLHCCCWYFNLNELNDGPEDRQVSRFAQFYVTADTGAELLLRPRSLRRRKTDATIVGEPTTEGLDVDHIPPLRA